MAEHRIKFDRPTEPPPPPPLTVTPCGHRELVDALAALITELRGIADIWARSMPKPPSADRVGPATGLRMERRDTPDHRDPNARSNFGFAPVRAGGDNDTTAAL